MFSSRIRPPFGLALNQEIPWHDEGAVASFVEMVPIPHVFCLFGLDVKKMIKVKSSSGKNVKGTKIRLRIRERDGMGGP